MKLYAGADRPSNWVSTRFGRKRKHEDLAEPLGKAAQGPYPHDYPRTHKDMHVRRPGNSVRTIAADPSALRSWNTPLPSGSLVSSVFAAR